MTLPRAVREAASRARQLQALERKAAARAAAPRVSWWLCPPDEFYPRQHARAVELNAVTVAYPIKAEREGE